MDRTLVMRSSTLSRARTAHSGVLGLASVGGVAVGEAVLRGAEPGAAVLVLAVVPDEPPVGADEAAPGVEEAVPGADEAVPGGPEDPVSGVADEGATPSVGPGPLAWA